MNGISRSEYDESVTILRSYRTALERQRDRFRGYLRRLEQRDASSDPRGDLEFHLELEQAIVREIASFERTVEPLEVLYRAHDPDGAGEIPALRDALTRARNEVLGRVRLNQRILRGQIASIRDEIAAIRTAPELAGAPA